MQIKTSHILLAAAVVVFGHGLMPDADQQATRAQQDAVNTEIQAANRRAVNKLRDSDLALQRVTAGCVPVVDADSKSSAPMVEGEPVTASDDPSGTRTLTDGTLICNAQGHTAEVLGGAIANVAIVAPEHRRQYDSLFAQQ